MSGTDRFDNAAPTWDLADRRVLLARGVTEAIIASVTLSKELSILDFGCGTGLVTLALEPLVGSITGADTSTGMLDALAEKAKSQGSMVHLRRLESDGSSDLGGPYDLIVSSMTLHHIADVPTLFHQFARHLVPGGQVALADLDEEDGQFHDEPSGVHHHGFSRDQIQQWLRSAGFGKIQVDTAFVTSKKDKGYSVFLVTARKD